MYKVNLLFGAWKIYLTNNKEKLLVNGKQCKGATHYSPREIYIDKNTEDWDRYKLIRHELSHAILYETQIEMKEFYTEEDMCEFMAKYGALIVKTTEEIMKKLK